MCILIVIMWASGGQIGRLAASGKLARAGWTWVCLCAFVTGGGVLVAYVAISESVAVTRAADDAVFWTIWWMVTGAAWGLGERFLTFRPSPRSL